MGLLGILLSRGDLIQIVSCIISAAVIVFLAMPVHEYAHGYVAYKLGDPTPRWQRRMTLNPMAHVDYLGALMILFFGFGWAKPVQVDARNFRNPKRDMAITALAGPVSNICFAFISSLLSSLVIFIFVRNDLFFVKNDVIYYSQATFEGFGWTVLYIVLMVLTFITRINISLAVFNLIPIPPLDGSKLLAAVLPDRIYYSLMRYERFFTLALILMLFMGTGISHFLTRAVFNLSNVIGYVTWLPFKFFV